MAQQSQPQHGSEVARLRELIEAEYASARRALHDSASGTAQHQIINAKMDRMSALSVDLAEKIGKDPAMKMIIGILEKGGEK